jgi:hypothetical protein
MAKLLIGYDLVGRSEHDYEALWKAIKEAATWWHHLDSTWIVVTDLNPTQMRDRLRTLMHPKDRLLVVDVTGRWTAWFGMTSPGSEWLKKF